MILELIDTFVFCLQFFWYAFWTVVMAWLIAGIWGAWQSRKLYKKEGLKKIMHSDGDALRAVEKLREFLKNRATILGYEETYDSKSETYVKKNLLRPMMKGAHMHPAVVTFFVVCHQLGCEVVIRQVGTGNIEVEHKPGEVEEVVLSGLKTMAEKIRKSNDKYEATKNPEYAVAESTTGTLMDPQLAAYERFLKL